MIEDLSEKERIKKTRRRVEDKIRKEYNSKRIYELAIYLKVTIPEKEDINISAAQ